MYSKLDSNFLFVPQLVEAIHQKYPTVEALKAAGSSLTFAPIKESKEQLGELWNPMIFRRWLPMQFMQEMLQAAYLPVTFPEDYETKSMMSNRLKMMKLLKFNRGELHVTSQPAETPHLQALLTYFSNRHSGWFSRDTINGFYLVGIANTITNVLLSSKVSSIKGNVNDYEKRLEKYLMDTSHSSELITGMCNLLCSVLVEDPTLLLEAIKAQEERANYALAYIKKQKSWLHTLLQRYENVIAMVKTVELSGMDAELAECNLYDFYDVAEKKGLTRDEAEAALERIAAAKDSHFHYGYDCTKEHHEAELKALEELEPIVLQYKNSLKQIKDTLGFEGVTETTKPMSFF